jgi:hypothetical protein
MTNYIDIRQLFLSLSLSKATCIVNQRRSGPLKIIASTVQIFLSVGLDPVSGSDPFSSSDPEPDPERLFRILILIPRARGSGSEGAVVDSSTLA